MTWEIFLKVAVPSFSLGGVIVMALMVASRDEP